MPICERCLDSLGVGFVGVSRRFVTAGLLQLGCALGRVAIFPLHRNLYDTIVTYLTHNGTIDKTMLFEPPFTDQSDQGIMGIFTDEAEVRSIIRILDGINANAEVA